MLISMWVFLAGVAQLVERLTRNEQVRGSNPRAGSTHYPAVFSMLFATGMSVRSGNSLWYTRDVEHIIVRKYCMLSGLKECVFLPNQLLEERMKKIESYML